MGPISDDSTVQTIDETRRVRLEMLIKQHGGKLANLNEALSYERTHSQLARIRNKNARSDRPGKFFCMGDDQAREIEDKLKLPTGWMDTPPSYAELHGENDLKAMVQLATEDMTRDELNQLLRMADILKKHPAKNGTEH